MPSFIQLGVIGPTAPATLAIVGIGAGLVLLYRGMGGYRRASLISDLVGSTISAIAVGESRVSGTIEAAELTLTSPLQSESLSVLPGQRHRRRRPLGVEDLPR